RLITVGGNRPLEGRIGSVDMALLMMMRGVDPDRITADEASNETVSSVRNAVALARSLEIEPIVFVSECVHALRVRAVARYVAPDEPAGIFACAAGDRGPVQIWRQVHYEAFAWGLFALPESWRSAVVSALRP
ncbi:MAG: YdcF family protein, partial [Caulobacterales bacterium]|nr:YdcF family protein [Caulobacterales bacterium]